MENSVNIPLAAIREKASALPSDKSYIICCDTGRRSAAAAFLLSQRGLKVNVLEGGLNQLIPVNTPNPTAIATAPAALGTNSPPRWSIEPLEADSSAVDKPNAPAAAEPVSNGLSELESIKQERDALEKRIRELEMRLTPKQ